MPTVYRPLTLVFSCGCHLTPQGFTTTEIPSGIVCPLHPLVGHLDLVQQGVRA